LPWAERVHSYYTVIGKDAEAWELVHDTFAAWTGYVRDADNFLEPEVKKQLMDYIVDEGPGASALASSMCRWLCDRMTVEENRIT
jgi:hypothetical protein